MLVMIDAVVQPEKVFQGCDISAGYERRPATGFTGSENVTAARFCLDQQAIQQKLKSIRASESKPT